MQLRGSGGRNLSAAGILQLAFRISSFHDLTHVPFAGAPYRSKVRCAAFRSIPQEAGSINQLTRAGSMARFYLLSTLGFCLTLVTGAGLHGAHADIRLDGTWSLLSSGARSSDHLPTNEVPFFTVADMTVQGFDGCNNFSGRLDRPGEISSTRVGCLDSAVRLPLDLNDLLTHLKTGSIENHVLTVPARGEFPEATFIRNEGGAQSSDPRLEEDIAVPAR